LRNPTQQAPSTDPAAAQSRDLSVSHYPPQPVTLIPNYNEWTTDAKDQYEAWMQQSAFTLSIQDFFNTINISLPLPVEELSVLPRDVTLNALQKSE
jgi:hypothetical protein